MESAHNAVADVEASILEARDAATSVRKRVNDWMSVSFVRVSKKVTKDMGTDSNEAVQTKEALEDTKAVLRLKKQEAHCDVNSGIRNDQFRLWACSTVVSGSVTAVGVRQMMYNLASENIAFYDLSLGKETSIQYDKNNLLSLNLVFETKDHIYGFENALLEYIESFNRQHQCILSLILVSFNFSLLTTSSDSHPQRVYHQDYCRLDIEDSPPAVDTQFYEHPRTSCVDINNPLFLHQRIENENIFSQMFCQPNKCYLLEKSSCFGARKRFESNENNVILLSKDFHALVDALNGDVPGILMALKSYSRLPSKETGRFEVEVFVEFFETTLEEVYSPRLKSDSLKLSDLVWSTPLSVENVDDFKFCLTWKTEKTSEQWIMMGRREFNYRQF
ncbi:hypothetical protein BCR33DRAFT_775417 [Rhizoclosmatium globosum]|uniref:Uncharacterized protein n=1 Tax=Rhizoclosmatium globosum TaxID=329046 RepID=A0A1Y2ALT7_9FUNG|nr:hypothetical protein BCR33DRAFT_775417 [Rhizoclosmatium globosum]|eukprot:ORY23187.1 hypothetical protein BCR33DRAFT_775417 [Rhizoclosmatium globosum]